MSISKGTREVGHLVVGLQHLTDLVGNLTESPHNLQVFITMDGTLSLTHRQRDHRRHRHDRQQAHGADRLRRQGRLARLNRPIN